MGSLDRGTTKVFAMAKTLPYEHLDVGASEKTIQEILAYSRATVQLPLAKEEGMNTFYKN
jgi:hypothetical protein